MRSVTKLWLLFIHLALIVFAVIFIIQYRNRHKEKLVVGIRHLGLPLSATMRPENILDGFDIEVARKIAKKLNRKLVIRNYTEDTILPALKAGEIDITCDSMAMTKRRLEQATMINVRGNPYDYLTGILWKQIPADLHTIHDLNRILKEKKATACVLEKSVWLEVLEDYGIKNIITVKTEDDLISCIAQGKALITFAGRFRADFFQRQNPSIKLLKVKVDEPWTLGAGICVKKENTTLANMVQSIIDELKADGTITQLQYKWFGKVYDK